MKKFMLVVVILLVVLSLVSVAMAGPRMGKGTCQQQSNLTVEQKEEMKVIHEKQLSVKKEMMALHVKQGRLTQEQANEKIKFMEERFNSNGFMSRKGNCMK